jgi:glucose-6-phosphate 1-dehydrogenase
MSKVPQGVGPSFPQVVVLVGATGDLSKRKLLPGLFHLSSTGFIPGCRIIGVSLDNLDTDGFREEMRKAVFEFSTRKVNDAAWTTFAQNLSYVPLTAGPTALQEAVDEAERSLGKESRRLHYLSVPRTPRYRRCDCWAMPAWSTARGSSWKSPSARTWPARSH